MKDVWRARRKHSVDTFVPQIGASQKPLLHVQDSNGANPYFEKGKAGQESLYALKASARQTKRLTDLVLSGSRAGVDLGEFRILQNVPACDAEAIKCIKCVGPTVNSQKRCQPTLVEQDEGAILVAIFHADPEAPT